MADYKPGDLTKLLGSTWTAADEARAEMEKAAPLVYESSRPKEAPQSAKKRKQNRQDENDDEDEEEIPRSKTQKVSEKTSMSKTPSSKTSKAKTEVVEKKIIEKAKAVKKADSAKSAKKNAKKEDSDEEQSDSSDEEEEEEENEDAKDDELAAMEEDSEDESDDESDEEEENDDDDDDDEIAEAQEPKQVQPEVAESAPSKKSGHVEKDDPEVSARTIFVGNVPLLLEDAGEEKSADLKRLKAELRKAFTAFGAIASLRLRSLPIESVAVPRKSSYKLMMKVSASKNKIDVSSGASCNAYVVFQDETSAEKAAEEAHDMEFHGRHLRVDRVSSTGGAQVTFDPKRSIFVGNVPTRVSDEDVRNFFAQEEGLRVANVRVVRDRKSQLGKGIAFVLFEENRMVGKALGLNGSKLNDRPLRITPLGKNQGVPGGRNGNNNSNSRGGRGGKQVGGNRSQGGRQNNGKTGGSQRRSEGSSSGAPTLAFQGARATFTGAVAARRRIRNKANKHRSQAQKKKSNSRATAKASRK